ncbi:YfjI family protein [Brevibacillus formosus]|uniref:YfjI family protein n=1 Tax=Brevibacillus formosus TaxID=54913 RepID=UPI0018CCE9FC|nr:YfjI family protein [Brevibacillus formosus]MBG9941781.1 hypothetical protein [Brevibacillus formosus]
MKEELKQQLVNALDLPGDSNPERNNHDVDDERPVVPLDSAPPFPIDALPLCLKALVEEGSKSLQVPPDFIALPAIVALGLAIGNSRGLRIKSDWIERANLYVCIVAEPGTGKSPAQKLATFPVVEMQRRLKTTYEAESIEFESEMLNWEAECDRAKKTKQIRPPKPEEPVMKEIFATDATTEALAQMMEKNRRGIILIQDELSAWVNSLNAYKNGKGRDKEFYLSTWSGAPAKTNRASGKQPLIIFDPFLSIVGAMPPAVLPSITNGQVSQEDGFLDRILMAYPDAEPQSWTDDDVSDSAKQHFFDAFQQLWNLSPREDGQPLLVALNEEAKALFQVNYNEMANEMKSGEYAHLRGVWSKLRGQVARLSLILHMARLVDGETSESSVDAESMAMALALLDYFKKHALRVYKRLEESVEDKRVRKALEWIKRNKPTYLTRREITRAHLAKNAAEANSLIQLLESYGVGNFQDKSLPSGRKTKVFVLNNLDEVLNRR